MSEPTELDLLKQRADDMGIKYSPNIGLETLRDKVNAALAPSEDSDEGKPSTVSQASRYQQARKDATKLVRVRITNLNRAKKNSEGEFFTAGNRAVKTVNRYVPFELDTHVEQILLNHIKTRQYCIVVHVKNSEGRKIPERRMRNEFQVEVLPALTEAELKELALEQAKRAN